MYYDGIGLVLILISIAITLSAQFYVKAKYNKYVKREIKGNLSGQEIARKILDKNGLSDIHITETKGMLSDHYDPKNKVVRLSSAIFHESTIASAAVAAHEAGHAIQDKEGYTFIKIRGAIFPLVSFASKFGYIAIMIGFIFNMLDLAWVGVGLLIIILFFQLITLPVEFNASRRALAELEGSGLLAKNELSGSKEVLNAAAWTYIAGLAATLLEILRFVLILTRRR